MLSSHLSPANTQQQHAPWPTTATTSALWCPHDNQRLYRLKNSLRYVMRKEIAANGFRFVRFALFSGPGLHRCVSRCCCLSSLTCLLPLLSLFLCDFYCSVDCRICFFRSVSLVSLSWSLSLSCAVVLFVSPCLLVNRVFLVRRDPLDSSSSSSHLLSLVLHLHLTIPCAGHGRRLL